jgi:flagellar biosynthesis GTPase FlhF
MNMMMTAAGAALSLVGAHTVKNTMKVLLSATVLALIASSTHAQSFRARGPYVPYGPIPNAGQVPAGCPLDFARMFGEYAEHPELREQIRNQIRACHPGRQADVFIQMVEREAQRIAVQRERMKQEEEAKQRKRDEQLQQEREIERKLAELAAQDREHGYQTISVKDFVLDGQKLASNGAKVSIGGLYTRRDNRGNISYLYADRVDLMTTDRSNIYKPAVRLLTDKASREFREKLLTCDSSSLYQLSCWVTVLGHATPCSISNAFGTTREELCVEVEDGRYGAVGQQR